MTLQGVGSLARPVATQSINAEQGKRYPQKQSLIDSIFRAYPIPPIFL